MIQHNVIFDKPISDFATSLNMVLNNTVSYGLPDLHNIPNTLCFKKKTP